MQDIFYNVAASSESGLLPYINLISTLVSALASVAATIIAKRAVQSQRESVAEQRAFSRFDRLIVEPALTLLDSHRSTGLVLLKSAQSDLSDIKDQATFAAFDLRFKEFDDSWKVLYSELFAALIGRANSWGDDGFRDRLITAVIKLEDLNSFLFEIRIRKVSSQEVSDKHSSIVDEIVTLIVQNDPYSPQQKSQQKFPRVA